MGDLFNLDPTVSMILKLAMALIILYSAKLGMDGKPLGQNLSTILCIVGIIQIVCPLMDITQRVSNSPPPAMSS